MDLPILWKPDMICACEIMQHRHEPALYYQFRFKCPTHSSMTDVEARIDIVEKCLAWSIERESNGN